MADEKTDTTVKTDAPSAEEIERKAAEMTAGDKGADVINNPPPSPERTGIMGDIAKFNEGLEPEETDDDAADVETDDTADAAAEDDKGDDADKKGDETGEEKPGEPVALVFDDSLDWETLEANAKTLAEKYDFSESPEVEAALTVMSKRLGESRVIAEELEKAGGKDNVIGIVTDLNKMFKTKVVDGRAIPDTEPFLGRLRKDYAAEYPAVARAILASGSAKYKGASMLAELLMDEFQAPPQKINRVVEYLATEDVELPAPPQPTPAGIPPQFKDAWADLDEVKRFEIEGVLGSIKELEGNLKDDLEDWQKPAIEKALGEAKLKLNGELKSMQRIQYAIDSENASKVAATQTNAENQGRFFNDLTVQAKTADLETAEDFVKDIAPKLDFVEGEAQTSVARSIMARVANAVSFYFGPDPDGNLQFEDDPFAEHFQKQLKDEGVVFDFNDAKALLQSRVNAQHKLALLKRDGGSNAAVQTAEHELKVANINIKAGLKELTSQITRKYVKSSGDKIEKKVNDIQKKKVLARPKIDGAAAPRAPRGKDTRESVGKDIKAFNRNIDKAAAAGESLEDIVFDRSR